MAQQSWVVLKGVCKSDLKKKKCCCCCFVFCFVIVVCLCFVVVAVLRVFCCCYSCYCSCFCYLFVCCCCCFLRAFLRDVHLFVCLLLLLLFGVWGRLFFVGESMAA